jgi:tetratricopeptide (TPR) repeat protein
MNTDAFTSRLSDYLDDELPDGERQSVDAHLRQCESCRVTLEELRAVVSAAGRLRDSAPADDLWPGIGSRIAGPASRIASVSGWLPASAGRSREAISPFRRAISKRLTFTVPQVAAASLTLILLSGGLVWMARSGDPRADVTPLRAEEPLVQPANFADRNYDAAVAELERTLGEGRKTLDPETVRVLERNLATIDGAIDQCHRALATDPSNLYLNTHLAEARQRKLLLLRRATALTKGT